MNDKIAWFEELLTLEPNSKLFLSLARAYVQEERIEDAVKVLQKGLSFHPEHLEARLLLIQCYTQVQDKDAAKEETRSLTTTLSGYPVFWRLWADINKEAANHDVALTLRLLAKFLNGEAINWGEILEQGLKTVILADEQSTPGTRQDGVATVATVEKPPDTPLQDDVATAPDDLAIISESPAASDLDTSIRQDDTPGLPQESTDSEQPGGILSRIPLPRPEEIPGYGRNAISVSPSMRKPPVTASAESEPSDTPAADEHLSEKERNYYETRTYATLLADQGETHEALEVFHKLLRSSRDEQHRHDLEDRIQALQEKIQKAQPPAGFQPAARDGSKQDGSELASEEAAGPDTHPDDSRQKKSPPPELVQTLTRLAERLEARGQA